MNEERPSELKGWIAGRRKSLAVYGALAIAVLLLTVVIPALGVFDSADVSSLPDTEKGKVIRVVSETVESGPRGDETRRILEVRIGDELVTVGQRYTELDALVVKPDAGDEVLLRPSPSPDGETYFIVDYVRDFPLLLITLLFCGLVIVIGRFQGLMSLIGIALSFLVILRFIIPAIISGFDPVLVSVVGAGTVVIASLYIGHGVNTKTNVALAGTVGALVLTALLGSVAIEISNFSGLASEETATVDIVAEGGLNARGLLLAGMIIGAIGVLDDVTVTQSSAVLELRRANPSLEARELYARGMNVGRDHIVSTVNTLVLVYAGASLPLLMLLSLQTDSVSHLINQEFIAVEIVRTLVGSIGIVASVPLTTGLAAIVADRR